MQILRAAVPPFMKNGFVVISDRTREAVVIDPGDEAGQLLRALEQSGAQARAILLTHAHIDHITGVGTAKAVLGVPVWLHADDLDLYDAIVEQAAMFGLSAAKQPPIDNFFEPGTAIAVGDLEIDIWHTPGHSPGGVCLAIREGASKDYELFVGDTLFAGSIGRTDLPGGSHARLLRSIREVLFTFDDASIVHPGHGPDTTIGQERRSNPFLV